MKGNNDRVLEKAIGAAQDSPDDAEVIGKLVSALADVGDGMRSYTPQTLIDMHAVLKDIVDEGGEATKSALKDYLIELNSITCEKVVNLGLQKPKDENIIKMLKGALENIDVSMLPLEALPDLVQSLHTIIKGGGDFANAELKDSLSKVMSDIMEKRTKMFLQEGEVYSFQFKGKESIVSVGKPIDRAEQNKQEKVVVTKGTTATVSSSPSIEAAPQAPALGNSIGRSVDKGVGKHVPVTLVEQIQKEEVAVEKGTSTTGSPSPIVKTKPLASPLNIVVSLEEVLFNSGIMQDNVKFESPVLEIAELFSPSIESPSIPRKATAGKEQSVPVRTPQLDGAFQHSQLGVQSTTEQTKHEEKGTGR